MLRLSVPTLLLAAVLPCQVPTSKPTPTDAAARGKQLLGIVNRLKSYDMAQVAWGAHLAAKHGFKSLIPDLRKTLHGLVEQKQQNIRFAGMALLDALIRLDAKLPPDEVEPWLVSHTLPAATVLMAKNPRRYEALLLDQFDIHAKNNWNSYYWLAAGNLLVQIKSTRIAPRILEGLHVSLSVNLYDAGSKMEQNHSIGLGGGAGFSSRRRLRIPKNYPPVPLYRLEKQSLPKAKLLAPGAKPIYYRRLLSESYRLRTSYSLENVSRRKLEWICALLDIKTNTQPFQLWDRARLVWQDAESYVRKLKTERSKVEGSFRALINRLQLKGLVTQEDVGGVNPAVSIQVFDHRKDDAPALPEIEGVKVRKVKKKEKKR